MGDGAPLASDAAAAGEARQGGADQGRREEQCDVTNAGHGHLHLLFMYLTV